jgi:hypothetical protein
MERTTKATIMFIIGMVLGFGVIIGVEHLVRTDGKPKVIQTNQISQTDSLQNVVDSLQTELESQAKRFDSKEKEYNKVIFEYELGIDRIEKYHPKAYEDFHRILAYKEEYSREDEMENKKRLKSINNADY